MMNSTESTLHINLVYMTITPIICVLIILGNSATIYAFWKLPSLRTKPTELLILNLSITDFFTGLIVIPLLSPNFITPGYWPFGELGCRFVVGPSLNICIHTSLFLLLAISIDRFLLVFLEYPKYLRIQSKKNVHTQIATCWFIAVLSCLAEQIMWNIAKQRNASAASIDFNVACLSPPRRMRLFSLAFFLSFQFTPVILVCVFSVIFLCLLRGRLKKNKVHTLSESVMNDTSGSSNHHYLDQALDNERSSRKLTRSRYIKPALSLTALVSAMAVCVLPYAFYVITTGLLCSKCSTDAVLLYQLLFLQFCNACLDPFLYALTQRKIQKLYCPCVFGSK